MWWGELKKTVLAVVSLIIFTCLIFPSLVNAEVSWDIQIVGDDASSIDYGYCPIKIDSDNNPHIAYSGSPKWGYVSWNGSGWDNQKLGWGFVYDLVLDTNDNPHITYGSLAYAAWNKTQWEFQTIATDGNAYSSIALDSSGTPHVAYSIGTELRYASQNGSNWTIQTVDEMPDIVRRVFLVLDSNDTPYIMYNKLTTYVDNNGVGIRSIEINLAVWKNSSWTIEPVLPSMNFITFGNMVLDSKGYPHFICTTGHFVSPSNMIFLSNILYVSWDGSDWNIQTVASDVYLHDRIGFLTLGPNEHPHIIYTTRAEQLIYTRWTGAAWENYTVDTQRIPDKTCYLAVDSNGNPHISYLKIPPDQSYVPDTLNLMYATASIPNPPDVPSPLSNPPTLITTAVILGTAVAIFLRLGKKKT